MSEIWKRLVGEQYIKPMLTTIHRVVEDQEEAATLSLVNNIEEQGVLEALLESTKPAKVEGFEHLDYLLITPFRYPPLPYGSRFGNHFEPGLFYGSQKIETALAETAYYRFIYIAGMKEPFREPILMTYSGYSVGIQTKQAIFLDKTPFNAFDTIIRSPSAYDATQQLGSAMRNAGVEAFQYISARDADAGINVALFTPKAFQSKKPIRFERWICKVTNEEIGFISQNNQIRASFKKSVFLVDGLLPAPAC